MKLEHLIMAIEEVAPPKLAASWDNCGLQVASLRSDIKHIALCLDPSLQSIKLAIAQGADFIISHHPLLMQGRLPNKVDNYYYALKMLLQEDVALYSAQTSLDVNGIGPAAWLASALNLQNLVNLEPVSSETYGLWGYGLVGELVNDISYSELLTKLRTYIDLNVSTLCGTLPHRIKKIAYCTGSGSSFMNNAYALGADIFITGDVKYHSALESPLCTLDVGHHSLEEKMMEEFCLLLSQKLSATTVEFIPSESPLRPAYNSSKNP